MSQIGQLPCILHYLHCHFLVHLVPVMLWFISQYLAVWFLVLVPAGFEPETPASKRTQDYALERASTGIGVRIMGIHSSIQYSV